MKVRFFLHGPRGARRLLLSARPAGRHLFAMLFIVLLLPMPARSQSGFQKLRYEEDWRPTREGLPAEKIFSPVKYIPLDPLGRAYLSMGGEIRERYEYTDDPAWGDDPQDERGVFLQRYVLHGDLHVGPSVRLFCQLLSALENGRAGGGSPVDEFKLTAQNAFVDLGDPERLVLRGGRQEVVLGSERLVSVREGPNVRRKFDGVRVLGKTAGWQWSPMWLKPAEDDTGILDDQTDDSRTLWGLDIVGAPLILPRGSVDLYYLGFRDKEAGYEQGEGGETRHSEGSQRGRN